MSEELPSSELLSVFAAELPERATWFVRLRWLAAAALFVFAGLAPAVGMPIGWHRAWIVAALVLAYNTAFHWLIIRLLRDREAAYRRLARCILLQIIVDLAALLLLIYLTGGTTSPFVSFVVFHMVIGTIVLSARTMAAVGVAVWVAAAVLFLGLHGAAGHPAIPTEMRAGILAVLACLLACTVYLTHTVASRFRSRGVQLFQLNEQLRGKKAELEELLAELRRIERRKSRFMLLSAHQLRSPLATVKTGLEVLDEGYVDLASPRGARLVAGAIERTDGLLAIVNDLLELAKIREGLAQAPWTREVNLNQLLVDILDALEPLAARHEVVLRSALEGRAVLDWGVPPDLVYALENLVTNAIKYSHPRGTVRVELEVGNDSATVRVVDRGIGIPESFRDDLFTEFTRAPNARHHAREGTGLGLSIAYEVVTAHGGSIAVDSREGEGTTATITLPLHRQPPERAVTTS